MKKKILSIILTLTIALTLIVVPMTANASYGYTYYGDANLDEHIDINDVVLVRAHIVGIKTLADDYLKLADANYDQTVDIIDVVKIRDYITNDLYSNGYYDKIDEYYKEGNRIYFNNNLVVEDDKVIGTLPDGVTYKNGVLTLNNAHIDIGDSMASAFYCDDDLTVNLIGENVITSNENGEQSSGIRSAGNLTIGGEGSLDISKFAFCLSSNKDINISNSKITLSGNFVTMGAYDKVSVTDSNLKVLGGRAGIECSEFTATNSTLEIFESINNLHCAKDVTITSSDVKMRGLTCVDTYDNGTISFVDSTLDFTGDLDYDAFDGGTSVAIGASNSVIFKNTTGTIYGETAAISAYSDNADNSIITFEGVKINDGYKYSEFVSEDGKVVRASIVNGDVNFGENLENAVTTITLTK